MLTVTCTIRFAFCSCLFTAALTAQVLDPLVVTAHRNALPRSQVPLVMDVFQPEDLNTSPAFAVDDQLKASAAFSLFRRTGSLTANPTAQGVSLRNIGPNGAGRTLVLIDGIPLNDPFGGWVAWSKAAQLNLSRVEIVRGGGSGAWGSSALGGTVQLLSQPANTAASNKMQFEVGDFGTWAAELASVVVRDRHAFSVNARGFRSNGYRRKAPGSAGPIDRATDLEQGFIMAGWRHHTNQGTTASFTLRAFAEDRGNGTPRQRNRTREFQAAGRAFGQRDLFGVPAQWSAHAYWQTQEFQSLFTAVDADRATERPVLDQYAVPADAAGAATTVTWTDPTATTIVGTDLRWVDGETRENYFRLNEAWQRDRRAGGSQLAFGVFGQHNRQLTDRWRLDLGARVDRWELTNGHRMETDLSTGALVRQDSLSDRAGTEVNPRVGLVWQVNPQWRWQAAAYQAFRLPTLNELYRPFRIGSVITEANPQLEIEDLRGAELGLVWSGKTASLRLTGFVNELDRGVANVTLGFGPGVVPGVGWVPAGGVGRQRQNLDRVSINGFEMAGTWHPHETTTWRFDYLYADAHQPATGHQLPQTPLHTLIVGTDWRPDRHWRISVQARHVSRAFEDDTNQLELDAATTIDLRVARSVGSDAEIFGAIENLFDEAVVARRDSAGLLDLGTPRFARAGVRWEW